MKMYTPDGGELIEVTAVASHPEGLRLDGTIMGAMPMQAILRPQDLRAGIAQFISFGLVWTLITMLFRR